MRNAFGTGLATILATSGAAFAQPVNPPPDFRINPGDPLITSTLFGSERNLNIPVQNLASVPVEARPLSAPDSLDPLIATGAGTYLSMGVPAMYAPASGTSVSPLSDPNPGSYALTLSFFYRVNETTTINNLTAGGGITAIVRAGGTQISSATATTAEAAQAQALAAANIPALRGRMLAPIVTANGVVQSTSETSSTVLTGRDTYITSGVVTFGPGTVMSGNRGQCTFTPVLTCEGGISVELGLNDTSADVAWFQDVFLVTTIDRTTVSNGIITLDIPFAAYGRIHAGVQTIGFDMASQFISRLRQAGSGVGVLPLGDGRIAVFLEASGANSRYDADGDIAAARGRMEGVRGGASMALENGWTLGVAGEWGEWRWRLADDLLPESADDELWRIGAYAGHSNGPWRTVLAAFAGRQSVDSATASNLGGGASTASYNATVYGAGAELGYSIPAGPVTITPTASLDWLGWRTPSFREIGGLAPLSVDGATRSQLRPSVGVSIDHQADGFAVGASLRGFLITGDREGFVSATDGLSSGGGNFGIEGPAAGSSGADVGAHASFRLAPGATLDLSYSARFSNGTTHSGHAGVRIAF